MPTPFGVNYLLQFLQYLLTFLAIYQKTRIQKWMFILYVLYKVSFLIS